MLVSQSSLHMLCWSGNSASYKMNVNAMELLCQHMSTQSINLCVDMCNGKQTALDMVRYLSWIWGLY